MHLFLKFRKSYAPLRYLLSVLHRISRTHGSLNLDMSHLQLHLWHVTCIPSFNGSFNARAIDDSFCRGWGSLQRLSRRYEMRSGTAADRKGRANPGKNRLKTAAFQKRGIAGEIGACSGGASFDTRPHYHIYNGSYAMSVGKID